MRSYRFLFFISFLFQAGSISAQIYSGIHANNINPNLDRVWLDEKTGNIKFFELDSKKKSMAFNKEVLQFVLSPSKSIEFVELKRYKDKISSEHIRYQVTYKGIPIEGSIFLLHKTSDNRIYANGEYHNMGELNVTPTINDSAAYRKAMDYVPALKYFWEVSDAMPPEGKLVILPYDDAYHLCYKFDIYAIEPLIRKYVYVDAHDNMVLRADERIHSEGNIGIAITKYDGLQEIQTEFVDSFYRLQDYLRGTGIITYDLNNSAHFSDAVDFTDIDNFWDETANQDDAATNAHFATEKTYDYFLEKFGRNSYDDNGTVVINYIHYNHSYNNALWDGNVIRYGDGDGYNTTAFTSVDIVAHEFTHAVTQYSAGLVYSDESGALNESFSDIFGILVENYINPANNDFLFGEDVTFSGDPFRSLVNPKQFYHPDTYHGEFWVYDSYDNGGIHRNCGVQNYWFYLVSMGGSGTNDMGAQYSIDGIGLDKAAEIVYRTLTQYLTPNSKFADARFYSILAAEDIFGSCSPEVMAVTDAWHAVGVGKEFHLKPVADFEVKESSFCALPASASFINHSIYATNYYWEFGDDSSSTDWSPTHRYNSEGTYNVRLIASYINNCINSSDTLIKENIIVIDNTNGLKSTECIPDGYFHEDHGILNFKLNSLNNTSGVSGFEGNYVDFSCDHRTILKAGSKYELSVTTLIYSNAYIWIDYDNDGQFSSDEMVLRSMYKKNHHDTLLIMGPMVYDTTLRLRVASDYYIYDNKNPCSNRRYGQIEDYAITITRNDTAPISEFTQFAHVINIGDTALFYDRSLNMPSSWLWSFPGGDPSSSDLQNPAVRYDIPGKYDVTLTTTNEFGSSTISKTTLINVGNVYYLGKDTISSEMNGTLFDSGGPNNPYSKNENYSFLIDLDDCAEIQLFFNSLDIFPERDRILIYQVLGTNKKVLKIIDQNNLSDTIIVPSGKAIIQFTSGQYNYDHNGFQLSWISGEIDDEPSAGLYFSISDSTPAFMNPVQFFDNSLYSSKSWDWDFGDGCTSSEQNPVHVYTEPGIKTIKLTATNCFDITDSLTRSVFVQESPEVEIDPVDFNVILNEGDTVLRDLIVSNKGSGVLNWQLRNSAPDKIIINEICVDQYAWIELYNPMPYTINLKHYAIRWNVQGYSSMVFYLPEYRLAPNAYVVITEQPGKDPETHIFADTSITWSHSRGGSCALYDSAGRGLDFVRWNDNWPNPPAGIYWTDDIMIPPPRMNYTLGRIYTDRDKDFGSDWIETTSTEANINFLNSFSPLINSIDNPTNNHYLIIGNESVESQEHQTEPSINDTIKLMIDAREKMAGISAQTLYIISNDTLKPKMAIPVSININARAIIDLSSDSIDLGKKFNNESIADSLYVINKGSGQLIIDSITVSNLNFTAQLSDSLVTGRDSIPLYLSYNSTASANNKAIVSIYSNDPDNSVVNLKLAGSSQFPPILELSHELDSLELYQDEEEENILNLKNRSGVSSLNYNLSFTGDLDLESTIYYIGKPSSTLHQFKIDTLIYDTLILDVTINGDYSSSVEREFAVLYVENVYIDRINDEKIMDGTDYTKRFKIPLSSMPSLSTDQILDVEIRNSQYVDPEFGERKHTVHISSNPISWIDIISPPLGIINPGDSILVNLKLNSYNLSPGDFTTSIKLATNDPLNKENVIPVHLKVMEQFAPIISNPISDTFTYSTVNEIIIDISNVFEDANNDELTYFVSSSDSKIAHASHVSSSEIILNPNSAGSATISIFAYDGFHNPVSCSFNLEVIYNSSPIISDLVDTIMLNYPGEIYEMNLSDIFTDPENDTLNFTGFSSDTTKVIFSITDNELAMLIPVDLGTSQLSLTANDSKNGSVNQEIFVIVRSPYAINSPQINNTDIIYIYPNPVRDILHFRLSQQITEINNIIITNILGKRVFISELDYNETKDEIECNISDMESGLYVIEMYTDTRMITIKFIKE